MKKYSLIQLIGEQRGNYIGHRRQLSIGLNPGSHKDQIISDTIDNLQSKYQKRIDVREVVKDANSIFSRTYPEFFTITMWPSKSPNPEQRSDYAIISTRSPSDPDWHAGSQYKHEFDTTMGRIKVTNDVLTAALTTVFYNYLRKDLENFGLTNDVFKTQKVKISVPKKEVLGQDEEVEVDIKQSLTPEGEVEQHEEETVVVKGDSYITGNIKIYFVEEIKGQDLRDYLELKGYDVGRGEDLDEQRELTKTDADTENEPSPQKRESPVFKTKKAVVIDNVSKLIKSLDELTALIKEDPEVEISDLASVFSDLVNTLNENGLIAQ